MHEREEVDCGADRWVISVASDRLGIGLSA
jgi:hypothetical protein